MREFRFLPHCEIWALSGFFALWNDSLITYFSGQIIGPIFKGQGTA
jgi:hypothetical protein